MSKKAIRQTNFNSGEIGPELWGHTDLDRYKSGLKVCTNAVLSPRGPVKRRNGFKFIKEVKDSTKATRLIKFQYSQANAYILEFGDQYIRFYKDGDRLGAPYELAAPYLEAELFEITYVQYANTLYLAHYNHAPRQLVWSGDTSWELSIIDFYPPALKEAGYKPNTTITPSATTGSNIDFTAGTATFVAADVGRQIQNLSGTGVASITSVTSTTVAVCEILEDFPSTSPIAANDWLIDLSAIAKLSFEGVSQGSITSVRSKYINSAKGPATSITGITKANPAVVTANGHGLANGDKLIITGVTGMTQVNDRIYCAGGITANTFTLQNPDTFGNIDSTNYATFTAGGVVRRTLEDVEIDAFRSSDVGTYIVVNDGVGEIISYVDPRQVELEIQKDFSTVDDTSAWSQETPAWSSTLGYPRSVTMHQQRLWFGGTADAPQTVWGSETGIFDGMGIGSEDTAGLSLDISAPEINQINWMSSLGVALVVGSLGSEMVITSGSTTAPITASNATLDTSSQEGSNIQQPIMLGTEMLFTQKSGTKLMAFSYNFEADGYKPLDLLFLANHLAQSGIKEIAVANDPDKQIYAVLNNGEMIVGTYVKDQQVLGWSRWVTDGSFESVATISTGDHDEVWCVIKRTINGTTKRYVERLDYSTGADRVDGFSDCYAIYSQPKVITDITQANPAVVTSTSHGFSNGTVIKIVDVVGMTEVNGRSFTVANATANTFELSGINSSSYTAYISGGEAHDLVNTIGSISHLEGKTVQVKADGAVHPDELVSSGSITLQSDSYDVTVGLPYEFNIELLPQDFDIGRGPTLGQPIRWVNPILRLYNSALPLLQGEYTPARDPDDLMDNAVPLFTGDVKYGTFTWSDGSDLSVVTSLPYPCTIVGITGTVDVGII